MNLRIPITVSLAIFTLHLSGCDKAEEAKPVDDHESQSTTTKPSQPEASPEDLARLAELESELAGTDDKSAKSKALFAIIELLSEMERDAEVLKRGEEYIEQGYRGATPKVRLFRAKASQNLGMIDGAIQEFEECAAKNLGLIRISVPASRGGAELRWERNLPAEGKQSSDRQTAYASLHRYVQMTERIYDRFSDEEKADWDSLKQLMESYGAHADTVPLAR